MMLYASHSDNSVTTSYWTIQYDASPALMNSLVRQLRQDPRVIRWTTLKRGEAMKDIVEVKESTISRSRGDGEQP